MRPTTARVLIFFAMCFLLAAVILLAACAKPVVWAEGTPEHGDTVVNGVKK